jgi:hypothetical protein
MMNVGQILGPMFIAGLILLGAAKLMESFPARCRALLAGMAKPNLKVPEHTVEVFLTALRHRLYNRAYNCLTDTAQRGTYIEVKAENYLQPEDVETIEISSQGDFAQLMEQMCTAISGYQIVPKSSRFLGNDAAVVAVMLDLTWRIGGDNMCVSESVPWEFALVKRGGYWLITNGFYWPVGRKYQRNGAWHPPQKLEIVTAWPDRKYGVPVSRPKPFHRYNRPAEWSG